MRHRSSGRKKTRGRGIGLAFALFSPALLAAEPAPEKAPTTAWTTRIDSMKVGSAGASFVLEDVRSTCNPLLLTLSLSAAAPAVRDCLPEDETRKIAVAFEEGSLASSTVAPDDATGRCVIDALADARLGTLDCALEADVSRQGSPSPAPEDPGDSESAPPGGH